MRLPTRKSQTIGCVAIEMDSHSEIELRCLSGCAISGIQWQGKAATSWAFNK